MTETYLPLLVYAILVSTVALGMLFLSSILPRALGASKPTAMKAEPYECGVPPFVEGARQRISVRFYLIAIIFILFDIETVFLLPWAVTYRGLGLGGFVEMLVFLAVLIAAYAYIWKRRVLEWE